MNKIAFTLYFWQLTAIDKIKTRREQGQGTLEYVGMIAVAALVIVLVVGALKDADLKSMVTTAIKSVQDAVKG